MGKYVEIHPESPQPRLIGPILDSVRNGGLIVYPTDTAYAFGCLAGEKAPLERLIKIRQLSAKHLFTLVCRDFSQASEYVRIENQNFRLLKACLPGPFTFILPATRLTPKRLLATKRKTIGIRVPDHPIAQALTAGLDMPLLTSTVVLPGQSEPELDPYLISEAVGAQVDWVVDAGMGMNELTTVVDLCDSVPEVVRQGVGDIEAFLS